MWRGWQHRRLSFRDFAVDANCLHETDLDRTAPGVSSRPGTSLELIRPLSRERFGLCASSVTPTSKTWGQRILDFGFWTLDFHVNPWSGARNRAYFFVQSSPVRI